MKTLIGVCMAIISLTILEIYALSQGINGSLFTIVIAAIAGLGGYIIPKK